MSDLLEATNKVFQDLLSHADMRVEFDRYDSQSFGSVVVVLVCVLASLRESRP